jgi:hypothetical protein
MILPPDRPPAPVPPLPSANVSAVGLAALLRQEQRRCWLGGQRPRVEDYLALYPALRCDPDTVLDLVYGEFILREDTTPGRRRKHAIKRWLRDGTPRTPKPPKRPATSLRPNSIVAGWPNTSPTTPASEQRCRLPDVEEVLARIRAGEDL